MKNRRVFGLHLATTHRTHFSTDIEREKLLIDTLFGSELVTQVINDYLMEKYCIANLPISIDKYIKLLGIKRTSSEERRTDRYKKTYKDAILEKYEVDNISKSKLIQSKKEKTCADKYGSYETYLEQHRAYMRDGYDEYVGTEKHKIAIQQCEKTCLCLLYTSPSPRD